MCVCGVCVSAQVRKQAEETIKGPLAKVEIVVELLGRVQQSPNPQVRQLAAVLLRKRITRHWKHLGSEVGLGFTCTWGGLRV